MQLAENTAAISKNSSNILKNSDAISQIPQPIASGEKVVGVGSFHNESAIAMGMSKATDNGKVVMKLSGTAKGRGDVGMGAGLGYHWR